MDILTVEFGCLTPSSFSIWRYKLLKLAVIFVYHVGYKCYIVRLRNIHLGAQFFMKGHSYNTNQYPHFIFHFICLQKKKVDACPSFFHTFGRNFAKEQSIHPDIFFQLAIQLTYYTKYGK